MEKGAVVTVNGKKILEYSRFFELQINPDAAPVTVKPAGDAVIVFGKLGDKLYISKVLYHKSAYDLEKVKKKAKISESCALCKGINIKIYKKESTPFSNWGKNMAWKDILEIKPVEQVLSVLSALGGGAVDKYIVKPHLEKWKLFDKIDVVALGEAFAGFITMSIGLAQLKKDLRIALPLWTFGSALLVDGIEHLLGWNPYRIIGYQKEFTPPTPPTPPAPPALTPMIKYRFMV